MKVKLFLLTIIVFILVLLTSCQQVAKKEGNKMDKYVLISSVELLSEQELLKSKNIIETRLNIYDPVLDSFIKDDRIVLRIPGRLKENKKLFEEMIKPLVFEAKIGNSVIFRGGDDIKYVCTSPECSGIDPSYGCGQVRKDEFACRFSFSLNVSEEAAKRQAEATQSLSVIKNGDSQYLSEQLKFFLDNVEIDALNIGIDLQGKEVTNIQISGSGIGRTKQEAVLDALNNMKKLQVILIGGPIQHQFIIYKIE